MSPVVLKDGIHIKRSAFKISLERRRKPESRLFRSVLKKAENPEKKKTPQKKKSPEKEEVSS